jgi:hypothetical protein
MEITNLIFIKIPVVLIKIVAEKTEDAAVAEAENTDIVEAENVAVVEAEKINILEAEKINIVERKVAIVTVAIEIIGTEESVEALASINSDDKKDITPRQKTTTGTKTENCTKKETRPIMNIKKEV